MLLRSRYLTLLPASLFLPTTFLLPTAFAAEFKANHMFVCGSLSNSIAEFDEDGDFVRVLSPPGMIDPTSIAFGPNGKMYVASSGTNQVFEILPTGEVSNKYFVATPCDPTAIHFGPHGYLYVNGKNDKRIHQLDVLAGTGQSFGTINLPSTVIGFDDYIFTPVGTVVGVVAGMSTIAEMNLLGQLERHVSISPHALPGGVAMGPFQQVWYNSDDTNALIRATSYLAPLDAYPSASFDGCEKMVIGPSGNLFIASSTQHAVIEFDPHAFQIVRTIGANAAGMLGAEGIAFAPSRFEAEIDVDFADDENDIDDIDEDVFLTVAPGSRQIVVQFRENKDGDGLAGKFFQDALVFYGTEPMTSGSKRRIDGTTVYRNAGEGTSHIDLEIKGSVKGDLDFYLVKKAYGRLGRAAAGGSYSGEIKTKKLLNG